MKMNHVTASGIVQHENQNHHQHQTESSINPPTDTSRNSLSTDSTPLLTNRRYSLEYGVHLRARLRYFFMSPCWKWHLKRQLPWKAWFIILKVIVVTIQLVLFGIDRQTHVIFVSESNITFHHLFVRDWDASAETLPYPRASGDFAVYTPDDFIESINYAVHQFNNLSSISLGIFDYHDQSKRSSFMTDNRVNLTGNAINLCINRFKQCQTNPGTHTYLLNIQVEDVCFQFNASDDFDVVQYLSTKHNETINYCGLNVLTLEFIIHAIQLKNQRPFNLPDCYHFLVKVIFDNNARTGKIRLRLDSQTEFRVCNKKIIDEDSHWTLARRDLFVGLDCFVLFITSISFLLCIRSLWIGHRLSREVQKYYSIERQREPKLKWKELLIFYSFWYFLMIITDLLIIPGTILKLRILFKIQISDEYNEAGILLGFSSLLSWISILRYLAFFRKYNLLFLTIEKAFPLLVRFTVCSIVIYCGFLLCGWLVFGPYHSKFETLSSTSDALFSLINGDDMYATFANLETDVFYIWLASQIYLLSFISLFIYVILSLSITLVIDGYETVKKYHINGYPKSRLRKFSEENVAQWTGPEDWQDLTLAIEPKSVCFPCCCKTSEEVQTMVARDTYLSQHSDQFR